MSRLLTSEQLAHLTMEGDPIFHANGLELLPVFDEHSAAIGIAHRVMCHRLGLIHKTVYCFISDAEGNVLLQTRSDGTIDVSIGGHVTTADSSDLEAVVREGREELGIEIVENDLVYLGAYFRDAYIEGPPIAQRNREFRRLYTVRVSSNVRERSAFAFLARKDVTEVISITWANGRVMKDLCQSEAAADGLKHLLPQFLSWRASIEQ